MPNEFHLPNFIIGGAQKCGTTSLHNELASHSKIFMSTPKELEFFHDESNFERGLKWYSEFFREAAGKTILGESCPEYLYFNKVPGRIARCLPHIKLLFILRNPVDRAYSGYWHSVRYGFERLSFEEALIEEPRRIGKGYYEQYHFSYIDRGFYITQLKRYLEHFDSSQILVLISEDYFANAPITMQKIMDFLGIQTEIRHMQNAGKVRYNVGKVPRSIRFQTLYPYLNAHFPLAARVLGRINWKKQQYPPMPKSIRAQLIERYRESSKELENLFKVDLSSWNR